MPLRAVSLEELTIEDEASFAHVALYGRLKRVLLGSDHKFYVPADGSRLPWDRALFLNLTSWSEADAADVLCTRSIPADVVTHVAWHRVVGRRLAATGAARPPSAWALLFAESIASAFDLYLVGRLLSNVPDSDFITSQVPIMSDAAADAGLSDAGFQALLASVSADPERAFESVRALLFGATTALLPCRNGGEAQAVLEGLAGHPFAPLLHHYQLSNWILYARAYADREPDEAIRELDATLRAAPVALDWLAEHWLDG